MLHIHIIYVFVSVAQLNGSLKQHRFKRIKVNKWFLEGKFEVAIMY
ncbi:hypothetical protein SAMN04487897_1482 [Paenibacillus sp. yr247]|nr:hypothetical protein SAMN04487897_1482 [Paenibacillus sp. yr247]